jgi:hypothetical protein
MISIAGDIVTVMIALWLYDILKDWRQSRRYHG